MLIVHTSPEWCEGYSEAAHVPLAWNLLEKANAEPLNAHLIRDHFVKYVNLDRAVRLGASVEAQAILWPLTYFEHSDIREHRKFDDALAMARKSDRPLLVHTATRDLTDSVRQLPAQLQQCTILTPCLIRSMTPPNAIARPYFIPDHLQQYFTGDIVPLHCDAEPSVAFCGVASPLQTAWSRTRIFDYLRLALTRLERAGIDPNQLARGLGTNMKHAYRARQIQLLERSEAVTTNFILRASGGMVDKRYYREDAQAAYNTEYFLNIRNSLYTLCSRGTENYAIRFYETLCLGRIPIIVDTELVLPFASEIDYHRHCVIIPQGKTHLTEEYLLRYHNRHGPRGLKDIQQENRQLWRDKLSVTGFYANLPATLVARRSELP